MAFKVTYPGATGSALPGGKSGSLRTLVVDAGFPASSVQTAIAVCMAESGGKMQAWQKDSNGSIDRGGWQINNEAHPNVSDACAYDPYCCARAAFNISDGGKDWSPWTTYQSGAYQKYMKPNADYRWTSDRAINPALTPGSSTSNDSPSSTAGKSTSTKGDNGKSGAELDAGVFKISAGDFADFLFDAFIKFPAELIGDYMIVPFWHWNQRAVYDYYQSLVSDSSGTMTLATGVFWGFGYVLLFTDPDKIKLGKFIRGKKGYRLHNMLAPTSVERAHLTRHGRSIQNLPSKRRLIKPSGVSKGTSKKPKPTESVVRVSQLGTMRTYRHERVTVEGGRDDKTSGDTGEHWSAERYQNYVKTGEDKPDKIPGTRETPRGVSKDDSSASERKDEPGRWRAKRGGRRTHL